MFLSRNPHHTLISRYEGANTAGGTPAVLLCPEEPPLSDNEEVTGLLQHRQPIHHGAEFRVNFSSIRFSKRSIIESTFVSMHALKRSAARSKRATKSILSSSDPVRGCFLGDLPADAILPVAMSTSLKSSIGSSVGKLTCSAKHWITVGVHGFGSCASVQLSLLNSSNSCSTSAELCTNVATEEDETVVVISCFDHFHKLCSDTTRRQTTINSQRQKQNSVGFLEQNGLSRHEPVEQGAPHGYHWKHRVSTTKKGRSKPDPRSLNKAVSSWST